MRVLEKRSARWNVSWLGAACAALLVCAVAGSAGAATVCKHGSAKPRYRIDTSLGSFVVELCAEDNPVTVANFISYIDDDSYGDSSFIHRSVRWDPNGFDIIQGGNYRVDPGPLITAVAAKPPIPLNSKLQHRRGTIAMARTSALDSATSSWFINTWENHQWDPSPDPMNPGMTDPKTGYTVFGHVILGMDVVDAIAAVPTYTFAAPFSTIPLLDDWMPGDPTQDHFVYVTDHVYLPEPGAAAQAAAMLLVLGGLRRLRGGA